MDDPTVIFHCKLLPNGNLLYIKGIDTFVEINWEGDVVNEMNISEDNGFILIYEIMVLPNGNYLSVGRRDLSSRWEMYISDYSSFNGAFPSFEFDNTITHPMPSQLHSTGLSSVQLLPNGNLLTCSGRQGYLVELSMDNEVVWEYNIPMLMGQAIEQGTELELGDNLNFRAFRYPIDYAAFDGKDLSSKGFIELNPIEDYCDRLVNTSIPESFSFRMYPNPTHSMIHLKWDTGTKINIKIVNLLGQTMLDKTATGGMAFLDISALDSNHYFLIIENLDTNNIHKVVKLINH